VLRRHSLKKRRKRTPATTAKKQFKQKDLTTWKWYDFYAAQGDEPLLLCKECRNGERHKKRVAEDRAASAWEEEQLLKDDVYD
jgi:hypothetical protein